MGDQTELEFGDFGHDAKVSDVRRSGGAGESTYEFEHSGAIGDDKARLLTDDGEANVTTARPGWWTFQFYQQYFDVDTDQVVERVLHSMVPRGPRNFIISHVRPIPDLYGPFWICVTLIFSMAICGNVASYLSSAADSKDLHWEYDFGMGRLNHDLVLRIGVTGSATAIFSYVVLVPLAIYAWAWYRKLDNGYSYLEILSAYGYSLGIFIPVSMLWMADVEWLRWVLIAVAVLASGSVLFFTFWPLLSSDNHKLYGALAMAGILALHCLLAVGCKELFFHSGSVESHDVGPGTQAFTTPLPTGLVSALQDKDKPTETSPQGETGGKMKRRSGEAVSGGTEATGTISTSPRLTAT